ncbi:MAG TPA: hypothetical protein VFB20_13640 [Burkholderiales bacterium]|nr:hypothetical protein [Burkholderiales bacterium]
MRIAIIRQRYNPFGGAERFVERAVSALRARGSSVTIVTRSWSEGAGGIEPRDYLLVHPTSRWLFKSSSVEKDSRLFGPSSEQEWGPWGNPRAEVLTQPYSCHPCGLDGCGGSKVSDCLTMLPVERVLASIDKVIYDK